MNKISVEDGKLIDHFVLIKLWFIVHFQTVPLPILK